MCGVPFAALRHARPHSRHEERNSRASRARCRQETSEKPVLQSVRAMHGAKFREQRSLGQLAAEVPSAVWRS